MWISLQTVFYLPKRYLARVNFAHCVNVLLRGLDNSLLCDITMNKCITYVVIWYASIKLHSICNSGFLELSSKWIFTQMHLIWPLWRHSVLGIRITFVGKTPSSIVNNVDSLSEVLYYVISGGRVSNHSVINFCGMLYQTKPCYCDDGKQWPRFRRSILQCRVPRFSADSVLNSAKEYQHISVYNRA